MDEGLTQGCPLSSIYASIILNKVIDLLNKSLCAWATVRSLARQHLHGGNGGVFHFMADMDDKLAPFSWKTVGSFFKNLNKW